MPMPAPPTSRPEEVYFFGTCLVDVLYPQAGLAAVELLERQGLRVIFPPGQTCCGQPPFNSGYRAEALAVARRQVALFPKPIPVIVPSGSCGAMLAVHYPELFAAAPPAERDQARALAARVWEWSDFLVRGLGVRLRDRGAPCRVAYHPSCHLLRELGTAGSALALLGQLEHVQVQPLAQGHECCGFGGTFSVKQAPISEAMGREKCQDVLASGAQVLVSADSGCLMHIGGALAKMGSPVRVLPLAQFVKERVMPDGEMAERRARKRENQEHPRGP